MYCIWVIGKIKSAVLREKSVGEMRCILFYPLVEGTIFSVIHDERKY